MQSLFNLETLIQATNYTNPSAVTVDAIQLQGACEKGSAIADSYLSLLPLNPSDFNDRFKEMLKIHAARLALDSLDGASADPQIREHAKEALNWLTALTKLSKDALQNLTLSTDATPDETLSVVGSISFVEEGRRWGVSFL